MIDMREFWHEFVKQDRQINEAIIISKAECENAYIKKQQFDEIEVKYDEYMGELEDGINRTATDTNPNSTVLAEPQFKYTQLPKITLPKFDGDYNSWRSFSDLFTSLIHDNNQLQPVQKLHYLKGCLSGDAEKLLKHTPITNQDYEPAWSKLKKRYENTRTLANFHLKTLVNQIKITAESGKSLKMLVDTTEECLQQLKALKIDTSQWDALLIFLIVQKLPFMTLRLWEEELGDNQELPKYSTFLAFLNKRIRVLESIGNTIGAKPSTANIKRENIQTYHTVVNSHCPACNEKHYVGTCKTYLNMDVPTRKKIIKASNRCLNCFSNKHSHAKCRNKFKCKQCHQSHHTTLHFDESSSKDSNTERVNSNDAERTNTFLSMENCNALLPTALATACDRNGRSTILRCLIDTGSQTSFITEKACQRMQIRGTPTSIQIHGLSKNQTACSKQRVQLRLKSTKNNHTAVEVKMFVLETITDLLPAKETSSQVLKHFKNLELADPTFWKPNPVDILLGADVYGHIIREGIRYAPGRSVVAINTIFGWIILGNNFISPNVSVKTFIATTNPINELGFLLQKFWEMEEVQTFNTQTPEDQKCEELYKANYERLPNNQYMVKLPFTDPNGPSLGSSRELALRRYEYLQRKLSKNAQLKREYEACLDEYITMGHMEECEPPKPNEPHYYIPHHAVFKQSTTTKLRVVFDASAKTTNGKSLNEQLLIGPTIQPKLFSTVLNWRKHKVVITADVEKMYRMIWMHPEHRTFQRILWRDPETKMLKDYQLKTVTFGVSPAQFLSVRTVQQAALDEQETYPLAVKATSSEFYVDDLLSGAETIDECLELQRQLRDMLSKSGFKLRRWASNRVEVISHLPTEDKELQGSLELQETESVKTLGIRWYPAEDYFTFNVQGLSDTQAKTKRIILSEIASLYDPVGWISPIIITAKILIQTLWIGGYSWDSKVSQDITQQWYDFKEDLKNLNKLKIPRWIGISKTNQTNQIHGFCDASIKAYAAVLYIRTQDENGNIKVNLLTAKSKVAPVKPITLPRLELNGALLLAKLIKATIQDMQLETFPVFLWTDATIVLQWIREHPSKWKTYVANRVAEIQDVTPTEYWHHVPTKDNPADLASRGITTRQILDCDLWWHGPEWLSQNQTQWPRNPIQLEGTTLEAKAPSINTLLSTYSSDWLPKYSSYTKLVRVIATVLRFVENCRDRENKRTSPLSVKELNESSTLILKMVQISAFKSELDIFKAEKPLSKKSQLITLSPFLDGNGLIRVRGRLENADVPYDMKHPIILPRDHHVCNLIIDKAHKETLHGGTSLVLNTLRNNFWILDGKRVVTREIHKCVICAKHRAATTQQLMGALPAPRVNLTRPFTHVGIDYAGPIQLKMSTHRNAKHYKGYFCIFVCMATKAIHIEVVSDLTSMAFIAALKRFVSRRGLCSDIYSDCGTNFKGGKVKLDRDLEQAIKEAAPNIANYLSTLNINWHFNPPAAPHHGGLWEAGVKSIKYHLRRVLGTTVCTFEELATLLAQIEACLNSRPLCALRNDIDDLAVLTPGHFLIGQALNAIPEPDLTASNSSFNQRWKHVQQMNQHFWKRWSTEYLNRLQQRPKWLTNEQSLKVGDVVLIKDENTPPTAWPLGIIQMIHPGKDGLVRVVTVRTRFSTCQRPIVKICRLPIDQVETITTT
ncbi:uncharacterized protein LOC129913509 [Episyrphus balteatus]|uniref:uncharacterized protein LOC129913509 n=1 Tax=Episyrphus balteatus TaxID=286459 RepID=UPI0024851A44|nr:uncharacterized protein LOC129913509 [Episyrphus balteatus]